MNMRLSEVVSIVRGFLQNTPSISAFENISSKVENIQSGWLFVALNLEDIPQAIAQGAYGIVYPKDFCVQEDSRWSDALWQEIAWIEVAHMQEAIKRLIYYKMLAWDIQMVSMNAIEYALSKSIITDKRVCLTQGDFQALLESLNPASRYIITDNQDILLLSSNITSLLKPLNPPFELLAYTLFDVRLLLGGREYLLNLPYLFIDALNVVCAFYQAQGIEYNLDKFESLCFLKPNFIDPQGIIRDFGQTQKVVIAQKDNGYFQDFMRYFDTYAKWGKRLYVIPESSDLSPSIESTKSNESSQSSESRDFLMYKDDSELSALIRHQQYNFMLILGIDDIRLLEILRTHEGVRQPTLFDGIL